MTLDDFFESINTILNNPCFKDCAFPLYRGHSKDSYELLPTLLRVFSKTKKDMWTLENNLYADFRALVGPKIEFKNSWQALFVMRHEGIPTRLLDWTENIGTALFFALESESLDNPHIWILNPYLLNEKNNNKDSSLINPEEDLPEYSKTYADKCFDNDSKIILSDLPIAIYPNRTNERIFAQRGLFTIHGTRNEKMELTCKDCIEKFSIPIELIDKLKSLLKQFGINKYSVYPDFKGLADYLKDFYNY